MALPFSFSDIEDCLIYPFQLFGNPSKISFNKATTLEASDALSLVWLGASKAIDPSVLDSLQANLAIVHSSLPANYQPREGLTLIKTDYPKEIFIEILQKLFVERPIPGIHHTAIVHPEACIGKDVSIGAFCLIGKCTIGDSTSIQSHCVVHDDSKIGQHVLIKSHTTIGSDGFGYSKNQDGHYIKFPHLGGVIVEDFVEIGSNTCIDRGTLGFTMIGQYSKIDNLVHIAHNVKLGRNCIVVAHVLVGGSTEIGDDCWIAPSATLRDGLKICSGVTIGMSALVTRNLDKPGIYLGSPAKLKE